MDSPKLRSEGLHVSLEPHLVELLRPLVDAIPASLSAELSPLLSETAGPSTPMISYTLLHSISRWARSDEGERALKSKDPPLDPMAYNMVALLAGTCTSPGKKFPPMSRSPARSETAARNVSDRRAIIAVLNALLSVICTGAAVWWAAQRLGWRDEWKVLLALLAATIVAISEVGLYIIWESRRTRRWPAKIQAGRSEPSHISFSVDNANSCDVSEDTPSKPARLVSATPQASTSIDPHQPSATIALRQRVGTASRSHSG